MDHFSGGRPECAIIAPLLPNKSRGVARVDAGGRPIRLILTPGQAGDAPVATELLEDLAPGATLIADRAYDTDAIRALAAERGAWANIPPRVIRKRSFAFSTWVYRQRNLVERFFNRINSSEASPPAMTDSPTTSSQPSSSSQLESGSQAYEPTAWRASAHELGHQLLAAMNLTAARKFSGSLS